MRSEIILFLFFCYSLEMPSFSLPSFAKINWLLKIRGKRKDGFHELCTVFQTVSLHDTISFEPDREVRLTCSDPTMPIGESNLIFRAARHLREKFSVEKGARIHLEKRIPAPGGLGGGSSNAAIALLGLSKLWQIPAEFEELRSTGAEIGSDVPFFLYGGTVLGAGRGTDVESLDDIAAEQMLIITPPVKVSTADAFARVNARRLTKTDSKSILQICRREALELNLRHTELKNDFESSVFEVHPEIGHVKEKLVEFGAKHALLSGSGASVFAVFENKEELLTAADAFSQNRSMRVNSVRTISRSQYLESLKTVESLLQR